CNQALSWLSQKELIREQERRTVVSYSLTELGREYLEKGIPEERVIACLQKEKALSLPQIAAHTGLENKDVGSAFGTLSREQVLTMDGEKRAVIADLSKSTYAPRVRKLLDLFRERETVTQEEIPAAAQNDAADLGKKRGAAKSVFKITERDEVTYAFTGAGREAARALAAHGLTGEEIGNLTPELLASGRWRSKGFREYNLNTPPVRVLLGRKNPYVEFLDRLKDKLVSLGFEEYEGPIVETEFWNSDALFMPQFHPARDIHDVYYVKEPVAARQIDEPFLSHVAAAHENGWKTGSRGWRYAFDREFTKRLILRSQGTVLSAKALPTAKVPGKYFGVVRCFRYDKVDATHLADFYQTEGIVLGEDVNLRTLLGLLKMFAEEVAGAKEVKYVPGYFPFTEPSVEVHIKHPVLGWFELGGAGIFRPEVTAPFGVNVPVLAWGMGIDRMALMSLGLRDLRDLFSFDIEEVRLRRRSEQRAQD
ncbi:MAG TPA: phenylalanine--tRNA ligase subunit alpha, partial [Spirochaetia bacterium]|nr:phenylalanine--tRNA ligase subunit alpha [Spirochaetia bacterium]